MLRVFFVDVSQALPSPLFTLFIYLMPRPAPLRARARQRSRVTRVESTQSSALHDRRHRGNGNRTRTRQSCRPRCFHLLMIRVRPVNAGETDSDTSVLFLPSFNFEMGVKVWK